MIKLFGLSKKNAVSDSNSLDLVNITSPTLNNKDIFSTISSTRELISSQNYADYDNCFVWVDGEVFNLESACLKLNINAQDLPRALLVADKNGILKKLLNILDGSFCFVLYDLAKKRVKISVDRYGMKMIYWSYTNNQLIWSTEVKDIVRVNKSSLTMDAESYDMFMELGYLLEDRTFFKEVRLLKPASILTYELEGKEDPKDTHYWAWSEIQQKDISFEDAVEQLGELFINAVKKRFLSQERVGIALSGGLDSRAILAAFSTTFPDYKGYLFTFGTPKSEDVLIAREVAKFIGWEHEVFYFNHENWLKPRFDMAWKTDGMQDMMHMHGSEFLQTVANKVDVNLNGFLGDAIFGGSYFRSASLVNKRINKTIADRYYRGFSRDCFVESSFFDIDHIDPFLYVNRGRRFINMGLVNASTFLNQRTPFFDNQLVEFIFSINDEYRLNNRLYEAMLLRFFPDYFEDIRWQKTGVPISRKFNFWEALSNKLRRKWKKLKNQAGYTDYPGWIREESNRCILQKVLEQNKAMQCGLTDVDVNKTYLQPHLKNKNVDNSRKILRAVTVETFLQRAQF